MPDEFDVRPLEANVCPRLFVVRFDVRHEVLNAPFPNLGSHDERPDPAVTPVRLDDLENISNLVAVKSHSGTSIG